jgi:hypothetical protein
LEFIPIAYAALSEMRPHRWDNKETSMGVTKYSTENGSTDASQTFRYNVAPVFIPTATLVTGLVDPSFVAAAQQAQALNRVSRQTLNSQELLEATQQFYAGSDLGLNELGVRQWGNVTPIGTNGLNWTNKEAMLLYAPAGLAQFSNNQSWLDYFLGRPAETSVTGEYNTVRGMPWTSLTTQSLLGQAVVVTYDAVYSPTGALIATRSRVGQKINQARFAGVNQIFDTNQEDRSWNDALYRPMESLPGR